GQGARHVCAPPAAHPRLGTPDRNVPGQGSQSEGPAGNWRPVRRPGSHDRDACRAQNRRCAAQADGTQPRPTRTGTNLKRITMQLVQATRDALLKPLTTVAGIVERRNTLPILANILMRKEGQGVAFIATDLEVQITTHADFGVGDDVTATTVAARKLLDILRALPDTGEVKLGAQGGRMSVQAGKSRFALQTLDAAEYPVLAVPEQ